MSLQIWLPLNGNLNNQGLDGVVATNNGATLDDNGKIGKCYSFSGSNSISLPKVILPSNTPEWSFACWFNLANNTTSSAMCLFSERTGGNEKGYTIFIYSSNSKMLVDDGVRWTVTPMIFSASIWYHLVVTRNSEGKKIYINGELKSSTSTVGSTTSINTNGCLIGMAQSSTALTTGNQGFIGKLNDVRIYDHCLSQKEIKELSRGLALHYKLYGVSNPNLIITNSMAPQSGTSGWSRSGTGWANSLVDSPEAIGGKAIRCTYSGTTQTSGGIHHPTGNTKGDLIDGATYTVSARIRASKNCLATFHNELQTINNNINLTTEWQTYSFSSPIDNSKTYHSNTIYVQASSVEQNMWIECNWIKLEEGDKATPWIPISTDPLYEKLGLNDSIEYDCSGYGNDGTKNSITTSSDSARYVSSYAFNGSNAYIRTNNNLWKSDGATELSINFWANMDDWTAFNTRLYSCTEGGGYNVELSGNNLSFSMSAYTNAEKSTYKYISDGGYCAIAKSSLTSGWHMFTYVYTTSGTKLYVDGDLKVNNTYTSYGVHYNMTAPLVIGAEATGSGVTSPYFNGKMNDFRLFYTALSTDDIKNLYQVSASVDNQGNLHTYEVIER